MTAPGASVQWSLEIDAARCDGHGICLLRFPEGISLDEWGFATVRDGRIDDAVSLRRARRVVAACPEGALRLSARTPVAMVGREPRR